MSKYKNNARHALSRGYWVDGAGVPQGPRGPPRCHDTSNGFPRFSVSLGRLGGVTLRGHVLVHQLAALILWGEQGLSDDVVILHLDRDRHNNAPSNLALGTRQDAQLLAPQHERLAHAVNAASKLRLLTNAEVLQLRAMRSAGATLRQLCERFGIAKSTASYIVNGKTYA